MGVLGARESLWVDELHSSWVVAGGFSAIAERAAAGNQTPTYFWLLSLVHQLLHQTLGEELALRLPSILAWSGSLALAGGYLAASLRLPPDRHASLAERGRCAVAGLRWWDVRGYRAELACICLIAWALVDRLQLFYATEARPYGVAQAVNLAAWMLVVSLVTRGSEPWQCGRWSVPTSLLRMLTWSVLAAVMLHLHLTMVLSVACQALTLAMNLWRTGADRGTGTRGACEAKRDPRITHLALAALLLAALVAPLVWLAADVWGRRTGWAQFAGDASWEGAIEILPFSLLLVVVPAGWLIDRLVPEQRSGPQAGASGPRAAAIGPRAAAIGPQAAAIGLARGIWLWAALGPWLIAWMLTLCGIAPLMHPRYVIVSAMPMLIWGAWSLVRLPRTSLVCVCGLSVLLGTVYNQQTWGLWRRGELIGLQRNEDWRGATAWLGTQMQAGEPIYCSSGLIEAGIPAEAVDAEINRYLSYPVRGGYALELQAGEPIGLVADWRQWPQQWAGSLSALQADQNAWVIYRGSADRLRRRLNLLRDQDGIRMTTRVHPFGNIAVVGIGREGPHRPEDD